MLERDVEQFLRKKVIEAGGMCLKWTCPQHRGVPDRIVMLNKQVWFVEVKSPTGQLSKLQMEFAEELIRQGFNFAMVNSKESAIKLIARIRHA